MKHSIAFGVAGLSLSLAFGFSALGAPTRVLAPNGESGDRFGHSVAAWRDVVVVGAPQHDDFGEDSGAAYVYGRGCTGWVFLQELLPNNGAPGDRFGSAVAIREDLIVVGAEGRNNDQGAAYVFRRNVFGWLQEQMLLPDAATDGLFGRAVAIDTVIVVGSPEDDQTATDAGAAYVFREGKGWFLEQKVVADDSEAFDFFGTSVVVLGDRLVVGSPFAFGDGFFSGAVYVYALGSGVWTFDQKIAPLGGDDGDGFGSSMAMRADLILIGAPFDDVPSLTDAGTVYEFEIAPFAWTQGELLAAPLPAAFDRFGRSVALHDDRLLVGAPRDKAGVSLPGIAHLFIRAGGAWEFEPSISAPNGSVGDEFGVSAAVSGANAILGAPMDESAGAQRGAAYTEYLGPVAPADFDADADTDLADFGLIRNCVTGPAADELEPVCAPADLDDDGDVDLADLAAFLNSAACAG